MNFENFKNISAPIESEDLKEKKDILFERIEKISLVYAEKKFQEVAKGQKDYKFSQAIKEFSPTENIILRPVFHLEEFNMADYQERIDLFLKDFYDEADSLYTEEGFNLDKISGLVVSKKDLIIEYLGLGNFKHFENNTKENGTKVLNFNKVKNVEFDCEKKYSDFENLGFSKFDQFIEVHVEDFYNTGEKSLGSELIRNDLAAVAEYIIDKEPQTAAVVGKSWLLDTPLASRLGFKVVEDKDGSKQNDFSTWLQFIDKNGQIDQKRFDELLENGEPPFKSVRAYMLTEDFLKRHLPENRKGKVMLKEVNEERSNFWLKIRSETQAIKSDWEKLLVSNGKFEDFVSSNKALNDVLDIIGQGDKENYVRFLKDMYDKEILWGQFFEYKGEDIEEIDKKIDKAMQDDLFRDKEVLI